MLVGLKEPSPPPLSPCRRHSIHSMPELLQPPSPSLLPSPIFECLFPPCSIGGFVRQTPRCARPLPLLLGSSLPTDNDLQNWLLYCSIGYSTVQYSIYCGKSAVFSSSSDNNNEMKMSFVGRSCAVPSIPRGQHSIGGKERQEGRRRRRTEEFFPECQRVNFERNPMIASFQANERASAVVVALLHRSDKNGQQKEARMSHWHFFSLEMFTMCRNNGQFSYSKMSKLSDLWLLYGWAGQPVNRERISISSFLILHSQEFLRSVQGPIQSNCKRIGTFYW